LTNPVADGLPARKVPPELLGPVKDGTVSIPLTELGQQPPPAYRLAAGDVLGVWIEGIHGDRNVTPPLHVAPQLQGREQRKLPPAVGYPVPVDPDGTVNLPLVGAVPVAGRTLDEAREAIRKVYLAKELLPAGRERLFVTLLQPRTYEVVVLRQEISGYVPGTEGTGKRGTGQVIELPAYENDVLHALAQTGGLPGLDACNAVVVFRGYLKPNQDRKVVLQMLESALQDHAGLPTDGRFGYFVRIPLRVCPGEPIAVPPEDVILQSGDVVYLEAREHGTFFTGGLLPSGEFPLPRDHDLDVVEAISRVRGPLVNGAFGNNNLAGNVIEPGLGGPSPSLLTVLRKLPWGGGRQPITVDLNRALRGDPQENLRVLPGDVLILQEKPSEALARYFSQTFFNFSLSWQVLHQRFATGVIDASAPERIPARIGITNFTNTNGNTVVGP
jgi:protein involved in polysaccharide export with SLBB domain